VAAETALNISGTKVTLGESSGRQESQASLPTTLFLANFQFPDNRGINPFCWTPARLSGAIRSPQDQYQGLFTSENRFHHAAVDPQGRTIGGRRKLAGQIGHHCRNFIHGGKAPQ
jgi:hypothetical protein